MNVFKRSPEYARRLLITTSESNPYYYFPQIFIERFLRNSSREIGRFLGEIVAWHKAKSTMHVGVVANQ